MNSKYLFLIETLNMTINLVSHYIFFACTQAEVSSRYHFLATVTTNLSEKCTYEFCGAKSGL